MKLSLSVLVAVAVIPACGPTPPDAPAADATPTPTAHAADVTPTPTADAIPPVVFPDAEPCASSVIEGDPIPDPADIIWVVDTSGSMGAEASTVESNLDDFAAQIDSWGIDYRVW